MSEDALKITDSVDPTFDAEVSERMDENDVGERFCEVCAIVGTLIRGLT